MRIAYLTQFHHPSAGGAAISVHKTAEDMAQRGHRVLVITASDREYPYHTYRDNIAILRLRSFQNPFWGGERFVLFPYRATLRALRTFKPDVIHAYEPLQMGRIGLGYLRLAGTATLMIHPHVECQLQE